MRRSGRRLRPSLPTSGLGADLLVLVGLAAAAVPALFVLHSSGAVRTDRTVTVLAIAAATGAGILLAIAAQLRTDPVGIRMASALVVLGMVVLPLEVVGPAGADPDNLLLTRAVAVVVVAVLLVRALRRATGPEHAWPAAAVAAAAVLVTAGLTGLAPELVPSGSALAAVRWVGTAGTLGAMVALLVVGTLRRDPLLRRAGLALVAGNAGHSVALLGLAPDTALVLAAGLRAAAFGMLVVAVGRYTVAALTALAAHRADAESRLRAAEAAAADTADREHEMRNAVAGLSGAVAVLDSEHLPAADRTQLGTATRAELERLRRMLERDPAGAPAPAAGEARTELRPLLDELAAVHRASGAVIASSVPDGLSAAVPPEVLAQVVTNLLVNCARHAPGARVWLRAATHGDRVRIEVADDGPGLPATASGLLRRGARGPRSTGRGLGLAISADLLARHHGTLRFERVDTGCAAVVEVPVRAPRTAGPIAPPRERVGA